MLSADHLCKTLGYYPAIKEKSSLDLAKVLASASAMNTIQGTYCLHRTFWLLWLSFIVLKDVLSYVRNLSKWKRSILVSDGISDLKYSQRLLFFRCFTVCYWICMCCTQHCSHAFWVVQSLSLTIASTKLIWEDHITWLPTIVLKVRVAYYRETFGCAVDFIICAHCQSDACKQLTVTLKKETSVLKNTDTKNF